MKVRVRGNEYCVHFMPIDKDTLGLCSGHEKCIIVAPNQNKRSAIETIWHEVLHAVEHEYSFNIGHKIIGKLETAIPLILVENPWLLKMTKKHLQYSRKRKKTRKS